MASVYILHSLSLDKFYIGSCLFLEQRLKEHIHKVFNNSFTTRADHWDLFLSIDNLQYQQARKIEDHIKRMKSKTYIQNLLQYPEIIHKLLEKYADC